MIENVENSPVTDSSASVPAGVVFSATHISCGTESEALAQQQALLAKQQNALRYSEAAHHHDAHLGLHLQKYERKIHGASEGDMLAGFSRDVTWQQYRHSRL